MSAIDVGTRKRLSIGDVVARAFEVMSARFVFFFGVGELIAQPMTLLFLFYKPKVPSPGAVWRDPEGEYLSLWFRAIGQVGLVELVLGMICFGLCGLVAFQHLCGERRSLGDNLAQALMRLFPVLGVSVLWMLPILGVPVLYSV